MEVVIAMMTNAMCAFGPVNRASLTNVDTNAGQLIMKTMKI